MSLFAIPTDQDEQLAGNMPINTLVAIRPLQRDLVGINTEYGVSNALRCQVIDLETGENAGTRLLFWRTAQNAVLDATTTAPWAVGTFVERPQVKDPSRSVYLFLPPDMSELDPAEIENTILAVTAPF